MLTPHYARREARLCLQSMASWHPLCLSGPTRDDLEHILQEEHRHCTMFQLVIEQFGGDPTAITPSANLHATAAYGVNQVIVDPRTTLLQSLEAILIAELADNVCWEMLEKLAQEAGEDKLVRQFQEALRN